MAGNGEGLLGRFGADSGNTEGVGAFGHAA